MTRDEMRTRYDFLISRLRAAARERAITLIAVSKTKPVEDIRMLYDLGHRDFGENYAQELKSKAEYFLQNGINDIRWHFIGHLQRNKIKIVLPYVYCIHSVDSVGLAKEIYKRLLSLSVERNFLGYFIQVNIDRELSKSGVLPEQCEATLKEISELALQKPLGLMCIPSQNEGSANRTAFRMLKGLSEELGGLTRGLLSMGMSNDYEVALEEGATHIRVGSLLFGARV